MKTIVGAGGYGIEMRERIVQAVRDSGNIYKVAQRFGVHYQTVQAYVIKAELGTLEHTKKPTGRPRLFSEQHELQVFKQLEEFPDATLGEHVSMLFEATGFRTSGTTIHRFFARHGITSEKNGPRQRTK